MKWFPLCTRKTNEQRKKQTRKKWWDIHSHASHLHGQLIYDQGTKSLQCGKNSFLNKKCWENWMATCKKKKKVKLDHYHTHKMTEWVKDSPGNRGLTRRQMHEHLWEELLTLWPAGWVTVSWRPRDWSGMNVNIIPGAELTRVLEAVVERGSREGSK